MGGVAPETARIGPDGWLVTRAVSDACLTGDIALQWYKWYKITRAMRRLVGSLAGEVVFRDDAEGGV